jgi:prepilin peptidase CpaA
VLLITGTSVLLSSLPIAGLGLVLVASLHDIVARTVPNGLALALAVAGTAAAVLNGYLIGSFLAAGGVFVLSVFCWRRGWMGGGDVKLLGAAALGMPPSSVPMFVAAVAIAGGLLALVYLAARQLVSIPAAPRPNRLFARAMRVERWRIGRGGPLPYACAIAAGFLFVIVSGPTP